MTNTYSGQGQVESPVVRSIDPSISSFSLGGVRIWPLVTALLQVNQLENNVQLAKNYYNQNKKDFDFWQSTYQSNMASALTEARTRPFYTSNTFTPQYGALDYLASTGRGQSRASLRFDREWLNARRKVNRYNVGHGRRLDYKFAMGRFNAELEGWNLGFRFEDNRKMQYDEQRHAHQAEILNLGIGAGNAVRRGLATAVEGLSEAKSQTAGLFGSLSNGLSTYFGFRDQTAGMRQNSETTKQYKLATSNTVTGFDVTQDQMNKAQATT